MKKNLSAIIGFSVLLLAGVSGMVMMYGNSANITTLTLAFQLDEDVQGAEVTIPNAGEDIVAKLGVVAGRKYSSKTFLEVRDNIRAVRSGTILVTAPEVWGGLREHKFLMPSFEGDTTVITLVRSSDGRLCLKLVGHRCWPEMAGDASQK